MLSALRSLDLRFTIYDLPSTIYHLPTNIAKPQNRAKTANPIYSPPVGRPERKQAPSGKKGQSNGFPWLLLILLLATIYFFWIYPIQKRRPPVQVTFEPSASQSP